MRAVQKRTVKRLLAVILTSLFLCTASLYLCFNYNIRSDQEMMSVLEESIKSEIKWHNDRGQRSHEYDGIFGEIRIYESGPIKALYGEYVLPTQKKFAFLASFKKLPFVNWYGSKEPIAIVTPVREPRTPIANGQKNKTLFASYEVEWFEEENPQRIISSIRWDRVILLILGVCVLLRAGLNWKKEKKTE